MTNALRFEKLQVWTAARALSNAIYPLTLMGSFRFDYELRDQINASSGSIMDNIAEGFERNGKAEFRQALSIAKGSCGETRSQLYRALDRGHISKENFEKLKTDAEVLSKQINSFISYLNRSEYKGIKFKSYGKE
jgi:four helix bundle protein